jgi:hypothetical protein
MIPRLDGFALLRALRDDPAARRTFLDHGMNPDEPMLRWR